MIKTAITGVMGSGKSTLSRILREMGYPVFDCDEASRQLMQPGTAWLAALHADLWRADL